MQSGMQPFSTFYSLKLQDLGFLTYSGRGFACLSHVHEFCCGDVSEVSFSTPEDGRSQFRNVATTKLVHTAEN